MHENIIRQTVQFLQDIVKNENVDKIKLANSFIGSMYTNEKYSDIKTVLNFQISDGNFIFTVNINKDEDGNIILFNIKKENI